MDDNTAWVLTLVTIAVALVTIAVAVVTLGWAFAWERRSWSNGAERDQARAELIRAKTARDGQVDAQRRDLADGWDDGYEAAARFHEGDDSEPRTNPYRAVK